MGRAKTAAVGAEDSASDLLQSELQSGPVLKKSLERRSLLMSRQERRAGVKVGIGVALSMSNLHRLMGVQSFELHLSFEAAN